MTVTRRIRIFSRKMKVGDEVTLAFRWQTDAELADLPAERTTDVVLTGDVVAMNEEKGTGALLLRNCPLKTSFTEVEAALKFLRGQIEEPFRDQILDIRLPSCGEIYGEEHEMQKQVRTDSDPRFPLLKRERIGYFNGEPCSYWLRNDVAWKLQGSEQHSVCRKDGAAAWSDVRFRLGIRPVIIFRAEKVKS